MTKKNKYPLPLPEELLDRLVGAKVFSKIDLRSGYWQMPIQETDVEKTAFKCRYGHFEFLVLPFGLTNAPPQFQAMINDLFGDMLDDFVIIFLDDLLIFSKTMEDHVKHLPKVLKRLKTSQLYARASKIELAVSGTEFVGHWVSSEGISPLPVKVQAIQQWKPLSTVTDVRSFLGMMSFYRRYIQDFAKIAGPLYELTKKKVPWKWGPKQEEAFEGLKTKLITAPVLILPDPTLPYVVVPDACDTVVGVVIM